MSQIDGLIDKITKGYQVSRININKHHHQVLTALYQPWVQKAHSSRLSLSCNAAVPISQQMLQLQLQVQMLLLLLQLLLLQLLVLFSLPTMGTLRRDRT